jgi:hypothetical protein
MDAPTVTKRVVGVFVRISCAASLPYRFSGALSLGDGSQRHIIADRLLVRAKKQARMHHWHQLRHDRRSRVFSISSKLAMRGVAAVGGIL